MQLGFSGFCGAKQAGADGSGGAITTGFVQLFFVVDGAIVGEAGNANLLCAWSLPPQNNYSAVGNAVVARQRVFVATPGVHTIGVQVQAMPASNGSNLVPMLGQTHLDVEK